jgi:hypothetical protein
MDKYNNMESDEGSKQKKTSDTIVNDGDVLPPIGVRCGFLHDTKASEFLRSYHFIFLPSITGFLWVLYLFI